METVPELLLIFVFFCASGIFSYFAVWILSILIFCGSNSNAAPAPKPGEDNMLGDYGDQFGSGKENCKICI